LLIKFYEFIMSDTEKMEQNKNSEIIEILMYKIRHYEPTR
jgi:hypothetical protein